MINTFEFLFVQVGNFLLVSMIPIVVLTVPFFTFTLLDFTFTFYLFRWAISF